MLDMSEDTYVGNPRYRNFWLGQLLVVRRLTRTGQPELIPDPIGATPNGSILDLGSGIMNDDFDEWYWPTFDF